MKIDVTQFLQSFPLKIELFPLQILYPFAIGNNHFSRIWPEDQYTELSWSKDIHKWLFDLFKSNTNIKYHFSIKFFNLTKIVNDFPQLRPWFLYQRVLCSPVYILESLHQAWVQRFFIHIPLLLSWTIHFTLVNLYTWHGGLGVKTRSWGAWQSWCLLHDSLKANSIQYYVKALLSRYWIHHSSLMIAFLC